MAEGQGESNERLATPILVEMVRCVDKEQIKRGKQVQIRPNSMVIGVNSSDTNQDKYGSKPNSFLILRFISSIVRP